MTVKIKQLEVTNFMPIGQMTAKLDDKGLVLIQGENRDDSSQNSNGSGKSTFADSISWCLYGETARGESGDDVIHELHKTGTRVAITLLDDADEYLIERGRKHKGLKNRVRVTKTTSQGPVDMTKGTDKETQKVIDQLTGCSIDVFNAAIYAGQEKMPDLPSMTDRLLKQVVEEAAGITELESAYAVARDRHKSATANVSLVEVELQRIVNQKQGIVERVANLKERADNWATQHGVNLQSQAVTVRKLKSEYDGCDKQAEVDEMERISTQLKAVNNQLQKLDETNDISTEQKALAEVERALSINQSDLARVMQEVHRRKHELDNVENKVGTDCSECGKTYESADLADARQALKTRIREIAAEAQTLKKSTAGIEVDKAKAVSALADAKGKQVSSADIAKQSQQLQQALRASQLAVQNIETVSHKFTQAIKELKRLKAEENPHTDLIGEEEAKIEPLQEQVEKVTVHLDEARVKERVAKCVVDTFSPKGVRAYVLDTVTPYLNERTAYYLSQLSDGAIEAVWDTLSINAKGEQREKFAITASSTTGRRTYKLLSGGEKRKVRLSCFMALQDLVATRSSKPIALFIADEIDDSLDTSGLERLMSVLNDRAKERGTVLVVSHNDLSDWIRDSVTMKKENGYSTLEGSAL
jgi:DNA repair exonuclease SbcCD ATPase subunit